MSARVLRTRIAAAALWLALVGGASGAARGAEPFVVGIGESIHDPSGATDALARLGVQALRIDAPWATIETAPGRYAIPAWLDHAVDAARARGIEPLLILDYGHPLYGGDKPRGAIAIAAFARYAVYVTQHFAGKVRWFDLWNEWGVHTGHTTPGSADDYVALARQVYPAIKAANPAAVVLSGGIVNLDHDDGWIERFVALGGLAFVDGLSLHPYNYSEKANATPEHALAEVDRVHELTVAAGRPLPVYVTEMGYPAYAGKGGVSPDMAAAYLARFVLLASSRPYVAGVWWYCLRDQGRDPSNKEHHFGVLDASLAPKPAAAALTDVARLLEALGRFRAEPRADGQRVSAERPGGGEVALDWRDGEPAGRLLGELSAAAAAVSSAPRAGTR